MLVKPSWGSKPMSFDLKIYLYWNIKSVSLCLLYAHIGFTQCSIAVTDSLNTYQLIQEVIDVINRRCIQYITLVTFRRQPRRCLRYQTPACGLVKAQTSSRHQVPCSTSTCMREDMYERRRSGLPVFRFPDNRHRTLSQVAPTYSDHLT